jgi:acid stress chaperone HdeB
MRKFLHLATCCLLLSLLAPSPAQAKKQQLENIDFGAITCKEFIADIAQADEDAAGIVLMWLDGYLSGVSGDTSLNWKGLEAFSGALVDTCAKTPNKKVLDVAKAVGINSN